MEQYLIKEPKLTNSQRIQIVHTLVDFLIEIFGVNASTVQKTITAVAAIVLFPGLEFKDGESTVRALINHILDSWNHQPSLQELLLGENGWLTRRLNYIKLCKKNLAHAEADMSMNQSVQITPENPEQDFEWLKSNLIKKSDREELIKKLNSTRELRKNMLNATETDLREQFPFFFAEPELVSVCIVIRSIGTKSFIAWILF